MDTRWTQEGCVRGHGSTTINALLISIVISPVVDKLQEYGKEQWNAEELLQLQFRLNGEQQRDG